MIESLSVLEDRRTGLQQRLVALGDFRQGLISINYRKCGKKNCVCARKGHPGHGPQYLWNTTTRENKSLSQSLRPGPELTRAQQEVATYKQFEEWRREYVDLNLEICRLKATSATEATKSQADLKKKLQKKCLRKPKKKSTA